MCVSSIICSQCFLLFADEDRSPWKSPSSLHLDLNPMDYISTEDTKVQAFLEDLTYSGRKLNDFIRENNIVHGTMNGGTNVQGVLNLYDNYDKDGGTIPSCQQFPVSRALFHQASIAYQGSRIILTTGFNKRRKAFSLLTDPVTGWG